MKKDTVVGTLIGAFATIGTYLLVKYVPKAFKKGNEPVEECETEVVEEETPAEE